jgi:hypothetical protein
VNETLVLVVCDPNTCGVDCGTESVLLDWRDSLWVNTDRRFISYDPDGHLAGFTEMKWDGADWYNYRKYSWSYDSGGNQIESLYQSWDGLEWVNVQRTTWTYFPFLSVSSQDAIPKQVALKQNYPNPFNPSTTIRYELPHASEVSLIIYDILGREVMRLVETTQSAVTYEAQWNGTDAPGRALPSGIYIARLTTLEYTKAIKLVLLK